MMPPQGVGQEPPPSPKDNAQHAEDQYNANDDGSGNISKDQKNNPNSEANNRKTVSSSTCKPVAANRPKVFFPSERINARIQYMRDHALIGNFIGIWPTERALRAWISTVWRPKGEITIHLGAKGFFTAVFNCLEDRTRILEGGPYFFNSAGLFLKVG